MSKKSKNEQSATKFTESYQFIQSMFQEPVPQTQRWMSALKTIAKGLLIVSLGVIVVALIAAVAYFDVLNITLTDAGLYIPSR